MLALHSHPFTEHCDFVFQFVGNSLLSFNLTSHGVSQLFQLIDTCEHIVIVISYTHGI